MSYADDLTLTLRNIASIDKALALTDNFKPVSGLKLNIKKIERPDKKRRAPNVPAHRQKVKQNGTKPVRYNQRKHKSEPL